MLVRGRNGGQTTVMAAGKWNRETARARMTRLGQMS